MAALIGTGTGREKSKRLAKVQQLHYHSLMLRLVRFSSTEIAMYFADHNPPHFHILGRDGAAQVRIDTLEIIGLSGRVDLREALVWAADNQRLREARWDALSGGKL